MSNVQYPQDSLKVWLRSRGVSQDAYESDPALLELVDIVFFASLETEEGVSTRVRVVYHEHGIEGLGRVVEQRFVGGAQGTMPAWQIIPFELDTGVTDLTVNALTKIAPATNLPRTAVVVGLHHGRLVIQGLARRVEGTYFRAEGEKHAFVLSASRPGQVALSVHGEEIFRYEGGRAVDLPSRPSLFNILNKKESVVRTALQDLCAKTVSAMPYPAPHERDRYNLVSRVVAGLVEKMATGNHGGLIVLTPVKEDLDAETATGKYRLPPPSRHMLSAQIAECAESASRIWILAFTTEDNFERRLAQDNYAKAESDLAALIDNVGQLSTIDNALLLGPELTILCAGYPITGSTTIPKVLQATTLQGDGNEPFPLIRHGSRHRAAANFANKFPGGLAFLCSQDGALRCLHRPVGRDQVLLWNLSRSDW